MGKVLRTFRGEDGRLRVVEAKSNGNLVLKPIVKLVELDVSTTNGRG